jgi:hypothetical protein
MSVTSNTSSTKERLEAIDNDVSDLKQDLSDLKQGISERFNYIEALLKEVLDSTGVKAKLASKDTSNKLNPDDELDEWAATQDSYIASNKKSKEDKTSNARYKAGRRTSLLGSTTVRVDEDIPTTGNQTNIIRFDQNTPSWRDIKLQSLQVRSIVQFFQKVKDYTRSNKIKPVLLSMISNVKTRLVANYNSLARRDKKKVIITELDLADMEDDEIIEVIIASVRPNSLDTFLRLLKRNVEFKFPFENYNPSAIDFGPFEQALYMYRNQFLTTFELLAEGNLLRNIPPISNDKEIGVIRAFTNNIPLGYGAAVYRNLPKKEYEHLEDFLQDFFERVSLHSKWGENSRELQMILTPSSEKHYLDSGIIPNKNILLNKKPKSNHFQSRDRLHMMRSKEEVDQYEQLDEAGAYEDDEIANYLTNDLGSDFQNQSTPIHTEGYYDSEEEFSDPEVLLKDPEKYLNYVAPTKEIPKVIPPTQHSYQKLLQRAPDESKHSRQVKYGNQAPHKSTQNTGGLASLLPCRNALYNECPFSSDPSKCKYSHEVKALSNLWKLIQAKQQASKYAQGLSHQDS